MGRPNSRVTKGHLDLFEQQPVIHIEIESAVRVHMIQDQWRQGCEVSWVSLLAHFGCCANTR